MLLETLFAAADIGRLHDIARVFVRHGFGDLVRRSGLGRLLHRAGRALHLEVAPPSDLAPAERMRLVLEDLGPTFVKLGQLLASRHDLLPPDWIDAFSNLHANVRAVPFEELQQQLEEDLEAPTDAAFADFTRQHLAAGSIAQVHRARLADGREVAVKIRRPRIEEVVAADLRLLGRLAELLESEVAELRRFRPKRIVRQFARTIRAELDFNVEARNTQRIAENMGSVPELVVPTVVESYTRERLLVMSYLDGLSAARWIRGERPEHLRPEQLARLGAEVVLKMVFEDGLYHADPHPGNVLFLSGDRLGLLDFGMVGRLGDSRRREFVALLLAAIDRQEAAIVDILLDWSEDGEAATEGLSQDCAAFLDHYHSVPLSELDVAAMLGDIATIVRENGLILPSDVALLIKVFVTLDGLGRALDPSFDLAARVEPLARDLMQRAWSPRELFNRGLGDLRTLAFRLPGDLRTLTRRLRRGSFALDLRLRHLEDFGHQLERSANRMTMGMVTAALIIGTSILLTLDAGPRLLGLPVMGLLGFVSSILLGLWLLWSIVRSGRR
ncbi:MAG: AarF/UbiB family protein [Planctomycetota bacterium]